MRRSTGATTVLVLVLATGCTARDAPGSGPASSTAPVGPASTAGPAELRLQTYPVPAGAHPHDVAPAADGGVWFTAQHAGYLGHLNPATGEVTQVPLGDGSAPHGVIVGPDGAAWVTDGGLNAIVRVDAGTRAVDRFPLPARSGQRQPQHGHLRPHRRALVHRPGRHLRPARPGHPRPAGLRRARGAWPVRDHDHAVG